MGTTAESSHESAAASQTATPEAVRIRAQPFYAPASFGVTGREAFTATPSIIEFVLPPDALRPVMAELERLRDMIAERTQLYEHRSETILLASLDSPKYRLRAPLPVQVERSEGVVVAHAFDLEVYAPGDTDYEALTELRRLLCEEYDFLQENESKLGPLPRSQLRRFRELLEAST